MLIVLFFSLSLYYLASSSSPRVRQQNDLQARNTRRPTRPNHSPFCHHCLVLSFSSLLYLSSHSLEQHLPTRRHYHAAAVCSFFYLVL
ncbi:hypothetical protein V8E52_009103, partial [Russula decolorans]